MSFGTLMLWVAGAGLVAWKLVAVLLEMTRTEEVEHGQDWN